MRGSVTITTSGRSGSVIYEVEGRRITGWWEFGGSVLAIVCMGSSDSWQREYPWALSKRSEILQYVAEEVVAQKAKGHAYTMEEASGFIEIE
jgi:hypothetical protein